VAEHDAGVEAIAREQAESGKPVQDRDRTKKSVEEVLDLDFGACKLQVQVPEEGQYTDPSDLVGKNIGTSFVHLAEDYFTSLEQQAEKDGPNTGEPQTKRKLKTKIIELSGSVEAACALGVADGIVDLVGKKLGPIIRCYC
jgi:ATP phosphoribosyltransferase